MITAPVRTAMGYPPAVIDFQINPYEGHRKSTASPRLMSPARDTCNKPEKYR